MADRWTARCALGVAMAAVLAIFGVLERHWDLAWTSAALSAVGGMVAARHRAPAGERARWTWWMAAAGAWLIGQVAWDVFAVTGTPPSPNLADAGWYSFALLVMAGLVGTRSTSRTLRLVTLLEALPLIVAATALTFAAIWPHVATSALPVEGRWGALAYPGLYVTAAVLTLQAMVAGSLHGIRGGGARVVLGGMVVQAVAFTFWSAQLLDGDYVPGRTLIDPLFVAGLLAIGTGGVLAAARTGASDVLLEPGSRSGIVPGATFLLLLAAQVRAECVSSPIGVHLALAVGLTTSGATLLARSVLLSARGRELLARERAAQAELSRLNARLAEDSRRDALTGLRNRRALAEDLAALGDGRAYAFVLLDVDHFKAFNDCLGHMAGDNALRALSALVRGELRDGDSGYRYGGEELLVLLPEASLEGARKVAERIRTAVCGAAIPHPRGIGGIVTVSVGVAAGRGEPGPLLAGADSALYTAKSGGRNRVMGAFGTVTPSAAGAPTRAPLARGLRGIVGISRAATAGRGALPVLEAAAELTRSELSFGTSVVNLRREDDAFETVVVAGDEEARSALLGSVTPWEAWAPLLEPRFERCGAYWLPTGSHEWHASMTVWTPPAAASPDADAWLPDDALLLPLRDRSERLLALLCVDEPLSGRRPSDDDLELLMAVADHTGLLLGAALGGARVT